MQVICKHCQCTFDKTLSQVNKTKNNFCSHSCSASFSNVRRRRKEQQFCSICNKVKDNRSNKCLPCYKENRKKKLEDTLLKDAMYTNTQQPSNRYAKVREHLHRYVKDVLPCKMCGYSKHVERCHIKAIKDFPLTATIKEINSKENIIFLCPNHHWEFDNGLIEW